MNKLIVGLLLALALPLFAEPAAAPPADEATAALAQLRDGLVSSFTKGDIDRLLTYLDPEVVVTWPNGEICRGPEAVRAFYQRMMTGDQRVVREIQSAPEVLGHQVHGDWAVSWGNMHDHFVLMDGSDLPLNSVFTASVAKRGDHWLVTSFHSSVNAFDNPVLGLGARKIGRWAGLAGAVGGLFLGIALSRLLARAKPAR